MDITVYEKIYNAFSQALEEYNANSAFKTEISHFAPQEPSYPLIVLDEPRNQPKGAFYGNRERVSSLAYRIDIYAKSIAPLTKKDIARELMQFSVDFMQGEIGLNLVSNNSFDKEGANGEIYHTVLVFSKSYFENKEMFI